MVPTAKRSWVEQVMGLPVSVLASGDEAWSDITEKAVAALYDDLRTVDRLLSPYKEDSAVSRLNRGELECLDADPLVREVSVRCEWARELTGGLFDTRRPDGGWDPSGLVKGLGRGTGRPPAGRGRRVGLVPERRR